MVKSLDTPIWEVQMNLEIAIHQAQTVQKPMRDLPAFAKYEALMKIAGLIREEREEFARVLCLESAKPIRYALSEVDRAIQTFIVAAEEAKRLPERIHRPRLDTGRKRKRRPG